MIAKCKIYLAGTIYKEKPHSEWKDTFSKRLIGSNNEYIKTFSFFDPNPTEDQNNGFDVVPRDKRAIENCDILVAYINQISIGTTMEIKHAFDRQNIMIIVINPNCCVINNIWLNYHSHRVFIGIEEAVEFIKRSWVQPILF